MAIRVIHSHGCVYCYLHETLGSTEELSVLIRELVLKSLSTVYPDATIRCLTPEKTLQKDFSACGVFALKALIAFEKDPRLDQWVIEQLDQYCWSESNTKTAELTALPAILCKLYQGNPEHFSEEQLSTIVSRKKRWTLSDYFHHHRHPTKEFQYYGRDIKANLSALGKRYKYLNILLQADRWESILREVHALTPPFYPELFEPVSDIPDHILRADDNELNDVNDWLEKNGCTGDSAPLVSDRDYKNACLFENFLLDPKQLEPEEKKQLAEWLKIVKAPEPESAYHRLMQGSCTVSLRGFRRLADEK